MLQPLRNGDLHLRPGEVGEPLLQRDVVVPRWNNRNPCRAAADGELSVPAADVAPDPRQPLPAAGLPEAAYAANHRLLERHRVVPAVAAGPRGVRLERALEPHTGVAYCDHDDAPAQPLRPAVRLHGDPSAAPGVLDDVLARL